MAQRVRKAAKENEYASISEFFRDLVRDFDERQLVVELRKSQEEVRRGKGKTLHSLRDLR